MRVSSVGIQGSVALRLGAKVGRPRGRGRVAAWLSLSRRETAAALGRSARGRRRRTGKRNSTCSAGDYLVAGGRRREVGPDILGVQADRRIPRRRGYAQRARLTGAFTVLGAADERSEQLSLLRLGRPLGSTSGSEMSALQKAAMALGLEESAYKSQPAEAPFVSLDISRASTSANGADRSIPCACLIRFRVTGELYPSRQRWRSYPLRPISAATRSMGGAASSAIGMTSPQR